jgi:uncharacterized protein YuzE
MTFTTDTEADVLAILFPTRSLYSGGELLDDADVVLEYDADNAVMRVEVLHYQRRMPALMTFMTALLGTEASGIYTFTRDDIVRFLSFSQLIPVTLWFEQQKVAAPL